jgi:hypothetical protein
MKQILTEQLLRMQKLAGILTENEYEKKLDELSPETVKKAYDKSKQIGQTGRTNIMQKGAAIYKAEEDEIRKAEFMKKQEEEEKAIAPVKEFVGKPYTVYIYYANYDSGDLIDYEVNKDTSDICDGCLYVNQNNHFTISTSGGYFIYNKEKDNFIIDSDNLLGVDRATALLLIKFAKTINPSSTLTAQNMKIEGKDNPLPVFGIHFDNDNYGDISINMQN